MIGTDTKVSRFMAMNQQGILTHCDRIIFLSHNFDIVHYEKKPTKNIRPTDILQIFSKCAQIY